MLPPIPDTHVAAAAADLLAEAAPHHLVHHSHRTFHLGGALVRRGGLSGDVDTEAAFVASMLHDIALTDAFRGQQSFELVGAEVAARFLEERAWAPERIALVERAIVRHVETGGHDRPETAIVHLGAAADVVGLHVDDLTPDVARLVLELHPATGFVEGILGLIDAEIEAQPTGAFAGLDSAIGLRALVVANPLHQAARPTST